MPTGWKPQPSAAAAGSGGKGKDGGAGAGYTTTPSGWRVPENTGGEKGDGKVGAWGSRPSPFAAFGHGGGGGPGGPETARVVALEERVTALEAGQKKAAASAKTAADAATQAAASASASASEAKAATRAAEEAAKKADAIGGKVDALPGMAEFDELMHKKFKAVLGALRPGNSQEEAAKAEAALEAARWKPSKLAKTTGVATVEPAAAAPARVAEVGTKVKTPEKPRPGRATGQSPNSVERASRRSGVAAPRS